MAPLSNPILRGCDASLSVCLSASVSVCLSFYLCLPLSLFLSLRFLLKFPRTNASCMFLMTKTGFVEHFPLRETGTLPFSQRGRNVLPDTFLIY